MILDDLKNYRRYLSLHPGFAAGFAALQDSELLGRGPGKYSLDGDRLAVILDEDEGRGRSGAKLEAHRRMIDIQYVLAGDEEMGWRPLDSCRNVTTDYSKEKDLMFFGDTVEAWVRVPPGKFVIFFPEDVHAPLAGSGALRKAVVKVAVDW